MNKRIGIPSEIGLEKGDVVICVSVNSDHIYDASIFKHLIGNEYYYDGERLVRTGILNDGWVHPNEKCLNFVKVEKESKTALDLIAKIRDKIKAADNERCASCGHPRNDHPFRHMFVGQKVTIEQILQNLENEYESRN